MSSSDSEGEAGGEQQQQQPALLGSGKARAVNRHKFKRLAERIDEVRLRGEGDTAVVSWCVGVRVTARVRGRLATRPAQNTHSRHCYSSDTTA